MAHISKFVDSGAKRIDSSDLSASGLHNVAFINPDGSKALLVMNNSGSTQEFKARWGSKSFIQTVEDGTVTTFTWEGEQEGDTIISGLSQIEAERFHDSSRQLTIESTDDVGGGLFVGGIEAGDYIKFNQVDLPESIQSIRLRVATEQTSSVQVRVGAPDGDLLSTIQIDDTGGWFNWKTVTAPVHVTGNSGVQDLYLVFTGPVNLNWYQFSTQYFQDSLNFIKNPGFETGTTNRWLEWYPDEQGQAQNVSQGEARSGTYKLDHWLADDYEQRTSQEMTLPNGTYRFSAYVRSSGGQDTLRLEANNDGESLRYQEIDTSNSVEGWTLYTLEDIPVTNGQLEVGLYSNAKGGNWANFDDISLQRVTKTLPHDATADLEEVQSLKAEVHQAAEINLAWGEVSGSEGYRVYRSITINGVQSEYIERTVTKETSFIDYGLDPETTYQYIVTAFNEEGESAPSSSVEAQTLEGKDPVAPIIPTNFYGEAGYGEVELFWDHQIEYDFLSYHLYQDGERIRSLSPVTNNSVIVDQLEPNNAYTFTITAEDIHGNESAHTSPIVLTPKSLGVVVELPNMSFETGNLEYWQGDGEVDDDYPHTGEFKLTHSVENDSAYTYRVEDVENGVYSLSVWIRSGGLDTLQLQVRNFNQEQVLTKDMFSSSWDAWTPFIIEEIEVTNGQIEFGVYSKADNGSGWAAIDDFELLFYPHVDESEEEQEEPGQEEQEEKEEQEQHEEQEQGDEITEQPSTGDNQNEHQDGQENNQNHDDKQVAEEEQKNQPLPNTATAYYQYLALGGLLILGALMIIIIKRKKAIKS